MEVGDSIILKAKKSDIDNQTPKTVTKLLMSKGIIRLEAIGPHNGRYALEVAKNGDHMAYRITEDGDDEACGPVGTVKLSWSAED